MKRKALALGLLAGILCLGMLFAGCGSEASQESDADPEPEADTVTITDEQEEEDVEHTPVNITDEPEEVTVDVEHTPVNITDEPEEVTVDVEHRPDDITTEPEEVEESIEDSDVESSWEVILDYGFVPEDDLDFYDFYSSDYLYSPLSFTFEGGTAQDEGDHYIVRAIFNKPLKVPADLQPGESCTVVINELTGETKTFTAVREEGTGAEYYTTEDGWECYTTAADEDGMAELLEGSADRLDVPFYEGVLWIRKDAVTGAAVTHGPYTTVTVADFAEDDWFNAIGFDADGHVGQIIFVGD